MEIELRVCCDQENHLRHTGYEDHETDPRSIPGSRVKAQGAWFLSWRFSFTNYASGEVLVAGSALTALAVEGLSFMAGGPATYAEAIPAFRTPPTREVQ
jgi:hypothetical protein